MRTRIAAALATVLCLALAGLSGAAAGERDTVAVRIEPGGLARAGVGAAFHAAYGAFDWAEVAAGDVARLRSAGVLVRAYPEAGRLVLPSAAFDPLRSGPRALDVDGPALHLVQFRGPIKDAWLDAVRARGARLVQYVAPFSYVVLLDPADAETVASLRPVRWAGVFDPAWRFGDLDLGGAALANALFVDDGRVGSALGLLASLGADPRVTTDAMPFADVRGVGVQVAASPAAIEALVGLPTLYSLSPETRGTPRDEMSNQIVAGNYAEDGTPRPGYAEWLDAKGLTGEGVVVANVDTGVDTSHPDLVGRFHGCRNYMVPGGTCVAEVGTTDTVGHGTHTAGIIAATGTVPLEDADGFRYGRGMAPGASLFVQNYIALGALFGYSGSGQYLQLNRDSVLGGATISANSWGPSGTPRGYDGPTREFDHAPRDANLQTPEHEPLTWVLSIMNGSGGTSTQGTPDEGKNLLRVGSTRNARAGAIDDLASHTAHGPALDGRRLPDVVSPGQNVISTRSGHAALSCATPVVAAPLYASCSGTSMASPHVSGAAALFTEHFREAHGEDPTPALVKAAFVNGAVDLAGNRDANGTVLGHIPDDKQGWGRINLENVLEGEKAYVNQGVLLTETGETWTASVEPVDPTEPVKITLVWTDAPGHGLGGDTPAWVNDLDLRVTEGEGEGAVTYLGNAFGSPSTGWSVEGGAPDPMNNIENVYLESAGGPLTVEVLAANLAGDGVPGNEHDTDQDFALVISNGTLVTED